MWVAYSIFNNKGASKIAVSYLLVTNQKRGQFFNLKKLKYAFSIVQVKWLETIQNRRKLFIRFRLQQTIFLCSLGKTDEFTNIHTSSLTARWGHQLSAWKCLVMQQSFHLSVRPAAFAPEQGTVLQGTKRANSLQSGKEGSIWHFVEPQTPGKARPEDQNLTDKVSDGIEDSCLSQNLTQAQRSQMPVEHRASFELTESVTLLLWVLNNFKEVDFFLTFF